MRFILYFSRFVLSLHKIFKKVKDEELQTILSDYAPISLEEMANVRLMNRIDTKHTASIVLLPTFLKKLTQEYDVQEINGSRIDLYRTMYLDTPEREMYLAHHNDRASREKIRVRDYFNSQSTFLEIKDKNNKGRTKKMRMSLPKKESYRQKEMETFLDAHARYPLSALTPQLENTFNRITLVNKNKTERLTIDLNMAFYNPHCSVEKQLDGLVIIELKQESNHSSYAKNILKEMRIHPMRISKYCIGMAMTTPGIKCNRYKKKIMQLKKIKKENYEFS